MAVPIRVQRLPSDNPFEIVARYFRQNYPRIYGKVATQVRRTPRRQTGAFKTNRASRCGLPTDHPDYTSAEQIPLIEGKLLALLLEFDGAPTVSADLKDAASDVLGRELAPNSYRCPVTGRKMSFVEMDNEAHHPTHGVSAFHVGHVRPRARGGENLPDNVYWSTSLGNRIQGDKTLHDTKKTIIEMAEYLRADENVSWGEMVNRYLD